MSKYEPFVPVTPINPVIPYLGGKRRLAKRICAEIDRIPHLSYVEPFCGMGGVFFRRSSQPKAEVINDLNRDVANFFRVVRKHHQPLIEELRYHLSCRDEFERLHRSPVDALTDIERAARFFYLQKCCFGGNVTGQVFGVQTGGLAGRFSSDIAAEYIDALHARLRRVVIEALPYQDILKRYDHPTTLFYLDPPYWGCEKNYGKVLFERSDFVRMASQLAGLKGRFIMSINDVPEIRDAFRGLTMQEVRTTYSIAMKKSKPANELIIHN